MEKDHKPSNSDLFSRVKTVADAAKSTLNNETDKFDKGKVSGAAADLLAAQDYGKLDKNTGVGQYVDKAENYQHQYQTSNQSAPGAKPESHDSEKGKESGGSAACDVGGVDWLKVSVGCP
ncbi:Ankyrin repeat family protein [Hibiscus syriacus]|uniref:Ankyrin repeat family protein n=1 Tax=Hibiscus syriacus TaxID=106335 RepID=A0A6A2WZK8_HIBSY|nr:nodulin-related protein 1-like [Hibiscus syriacus]KAE8667652.1 Ankyrin repeat family protein [Hibiscus syriacus]